MIDAQAGRKDVLDREVEHRLGITSSSRAAAPRGVTAGVRAGRLADGLIGQAVQPLGEQVHDRVAETTESSGGKESWRGSGMRRA